MGKSNVLVLENDIAVLAELAFSSGEHSTNPKAFFDWANYDQTL